MKKIAAVVLLCLFVTLVKAQYVNYEIKIVTDSTTSVKGTLYKVTPEGLGVMDKMGNYRIIRAKNIVKIRVRKKGLKMETAIGGGAGLGLAGGAAIFFGDENSDLDLGSKIGGTAVLTVAGAATGLIVGLVSEAIHLRIVLVIDGNEQRYRDNYKRLERYSRERTMGENLAANP